MKPRLQMLTEEQQAERDRRIVELIRQGLSRATVARRVQCSLFAIGHAIRSAREAK